MRTSLALSALLATAVASSTPDLAPQAKPAVNVYWGQTGQGDRLADYCAGGGFEYVSLAFVNISPENGGPSGYPGTGFAAHCSATTFVHNGAPSKLLSDCTQIKEDIPKCQAMGKKIILSIGGVLTPESNYTVTSIPNGIEFADFLWGAFGPVNASWTGPRPFDISEDEPVVVDGFDFDLEAYWSNEIQASWVAMIDRLRDLGCDLITAAPQCPVVPRWFQLLYIIEHTRFDILNIQFYNNYGCDATEGGSHFNFANWVSVLLSSPSKDGKLFVGLPAIEGSDGYVSPGELFPVLDSIRHYPQFGGVMIWDAHWATENVDEKGLNYYQAIHEYLMKPWPPASSSTTTTAVATTRTAMPTPSKSTPRPTTTLSTVKKTTPFVPSATPVHRHTASL